jgi:hypothetical protein
LKKAAAIVFISMATGTALASTTWQKMGLIDRRDNRNNVSPERPADPNYSYFGASFATVVTKAFALALALFSDLRTLEPVFW